MYLLRFILLCFDMVNDFLGKNCQYIAGAVAFYTLFSMFPLVLAIVSIWGFFSGQEVERAALAAQMAEVIPVSSEFIGQTMSGVVSARAITGIVSVAAMVWASVHRVRRHSQGHQHSVGRYQNQTVHPRTAH